MLSDTCHAAGYATRGKDLELQKPKSPEMDKASLLYVLEGNTFSVFQGCLLCKHPGEDGLEQRWSVPLLANTQEQQRPTESCLPQGSKWDAAQSEWHLDYRPVQGRAPERQRRRKTFPVRRTESSAPGHPLCGLRGGYSDSWAGQSLRVKELEDWPGVPGRDMLVDVGAGH